jgi:predicted amidohydrolase YtcJ
MLSSAVVSKLSVALLVAVALAAAKSQPSPKPGPAPRPAGEPADLVLTGGRILTLDGTHPEVRALAARGERIVALGSEAEIAPWIGPQTRVIQLGDGLAIPGLIEGHGHFLGLGFFRTQLDLTKAKSWDEIVALVAEKARTAAPGEWILGRGWHQDKWNAVPQPNVEGLPLHATLSAVSPNNPVYLDHASGHAAFVNAKAMELAGVTRTTQPPAGGEILHDGAGEPTGLFRENAAGLVARKAAPTTAELGRAAELAARESLAKGITSFQDAGSSVEEAAFLRGLALDGKLPVRLWVMLSDSAEKLAYELPEVTAWPKHPFFEVGGIKRWMDGALGSHGAWLLAPYADLPSSTGLATLSPTEAEASARLAARYKLQYCVHAIGDRANREVLDLFARTFAENPTRRDWRWRIEHAQHLDPADIPRFAQLGVIASMQAVHATSDGPWVPNRLGEKRSREGAYVWRKLLQSGAIVVNGTDTPVEDIDPLANLFAATTRKMGSGKAFYIEQKMSMTEALRSATWNAAYAAFQERDKGSLEVGKLADITVLARDVTKVIDTEIPKTPVRFTIVGGKVAYEGGGR